MSEKKVQDVFKQKSNFYIYLKKYFLKFAYRVRKYKEFDFKNHNFEILVKHKKISISKVTFLTMVLYIFRIIFKN